MSNILLLLLLQAFLILAACRTTPAPPLATVTPIPSGTLFSLEKAPKTIPSPADTPRAARTFLEATTIPQPTLPPTPLVTFSPTPPPASDISAALNTEVLIRNLEVPWSLAFDPDGRLFFTERAGRIRLWERGLLQTAPVAVLAAAPVGEGGLLGLVLAPDFVQTHFMYVYYTYRNAGGGLSNKVERFTEQNGKGTNPLTILDSIPGASIHDGGRLRFGPDGKLYVTTGDAANTANAQDLKSLGGKVLRLNRDGSIPADNPFPGSPVYSYGHRNPQGLDWHPETGVLFETEHGPIAHDEVNIITPGGNYGWPNAVGEQTVPNFTSPLLQTGNDTWAPSGTTFYRGSLMAKWQGNLFVATLRGEHLHRLALKAPDFREIAASQVLFQSAFGRLRDVAEGPDGALYIITNNRDGRGNPSPEDDRLVRILLR